MATDAEKFEAIKRKLSKDLGRPVTDAETHEAIMAAGRTALYTEFFDKMMKAGA